MGFSYSSIAQTALAQIADKGKDISILYKTKGHYNPQTDTRSRDLKKKVPARGLFTEIRASLIDGTIIQRGDKFLLLAAQAVDKPSLGDIIYTADGEEFLVKNVETVSPGNLDVLYRVQVRR